MAQLAQCRSVDGSTRPRGRPGLSRARATPRRVHDSTRRAHYGLQPRAAVAFTRSCSTCPDPVSLRHARSRTCVRVPVCMASFSFSRPCQQLDYKRPGISFPVPHLTCPSKGVGNLACMQMDLEG